MRTTAIAIIFALFAFLAPPGVSAADSDTESKPAYTNLFDTLKKISDSLDGMRTNTRARKVLSKKYAKLKKQEFNLLVTKVKDDHVRAEIIVPNGQPVPEKIVFSQYRLKKNINGIRLYIGQKVLFRGDVVLLAPIKGPSGRTFIPILPAHMRIFQVTGRNDKVIASYLSTNYKILTDSAIKAKYNIRSISAKEVLLSLSATNTSTKDVYLLRWATPFERLPFHRYIEVSTDGARLAYKGIIFKRETPTAKSYIKIAPGKTVTGSTNIAQSFDFTEDGKYTIKLDGRLEYRDKAPDEKYNREDPYNIKAKIVWEKEFLIPVNDE